MWRLGCNASRKIRLRRDCRADLAKLIAPKFFRPVLSAFAAEALLSLSPTKNGNYTLGATLRYGHRYGRLGSRGAPENLRICRNKGRRVPFCCSSDRSSSISARRPDCEGGLQNQQRRMPHRSILLPRIRRTVEQLDGPAKHRLQLLVSVLIARHAAVTNPPDSG